MKQEQYIKQRLGALGFEALNEMQLSTLEQYNRKEDLILLSPTGSGKTVAFLLPLILSLSETKKETQALIIVPSRELALQIERVFKTMKTAFSSVCCYGGHDMKAEKNKLATFPEVVIGTPGRLLDHIEQGSLITNDIHTLILDEFDKALELGFTEEMSAIISKLPNLTKRVLTSATDGTEIPDYTGLKNPITLSFLTKSNVSERLDLFQIQSPVSDKLDTLYRLICELGEGQKLVFTNYRESSERVSQFLTKSGIQNVVFHGGMEQADREKALARYRNGSANILVSTDLAARGLDIPEIKHIIHYHLPVNQESFIHRNGRTARMDKTGSAYIILSPNEYLPEYINGNTPFQKLSEQTPAPSLPQWTTIYIGKGKKDKLSKGDIAGFMIQKGELKKEDVGMIEVNDFHSFVAIPTTCVKSVLNKIKGLKIKNLKTIFAVAS